LAIATESEMSESEQVRTGSCLCKGVSYRITGECREVINCFCSQCQKTTGHHFAATRVNLDQFKLLADSTLAWYASSDQARRGFCNRCGSSLFWQRNGTDLISITAGTIDKPTRLVTTENIFVEDKSDYHDLPELK
jgi:hypothetical protein